MTIKNGTNSGERRLERSNHPNKHSNDHQTEYLMNNNHLVNEICDQLGWTDMVSKVQMNVIDIYALNDTYSQANMIDEDTLKEWVNIEPRKDHAKFETANVERRNRLFMSWHWQRMSTYHHVWNP